MILLDPSKLEHIRAPIDEMVIEDYLFRSISTVRSLKLMIGELGFEPLAVPFRGWWFAGAIRSPIEEQQFEDWVGEILFFANSRHAVDRKIRNRAKELAHHVLDNSVCAANRALALQGLVVRVIDPDTDIAFDDDEWWKWYSAPPPSDHRQAWATHYRAELGEIREYLEHEGRALDRANELVRLGHYDRFDHALTQTLLLDQDDEDDWPG